MKINSDLGVASSIATAIANSLDGISTGGVITCDTETTISGNRDAGEAIQTISESRNNVLKAVGQASLNLQSVASEFEAMDKAARELFKNPLSNLNGGGSK